MTRKTSLRAVFTPSAFLPSLGAIGAGVILMALQTTSAQAAGQYYNCANPTGCKLVSSKYFTSKHTDTKYPVVMAHGLGGFTKAFGLVDYFYGIPESLMSGGSQVYTTKTSSVNNSEFRGEQLLQQVKTISAISGSPKVNLLGHSQGGIDSRYVAAVEPKYVASVTAISSPEQGSKMSDWVIKQVVEGSANDGYGEGEFNVGSQIALGFFKLVGGFMDVSAGISLKELQEQDGWNALEALSTDYAAKFNVKFPAAMPTSYCGQPADTEVNGIKYYSFSGIGQITNGLDPSDYLLALTGTTFNGDPNDGLVSACSSRLGYVVRDDYRMNHLDSANQVLGLTAWGQPDPKTLYRDQVNRLKKANL
ncbi:triacylglycerol lipase [Psychrobacter sp. DAB_AL32B]|uniref:esterase/lipase family protein n=1 Tax=Psychrobacter sp. DAB_AL32B TaxID=1028414 RepID=UPI000B7C6679|nr:triacylglycerol lipase [Psychrobacter sp. DAB_AL32B]OXL23379.1 alpha/beta hydrolase [Psychrobacter sp. DAB_AL32B]